MRKILSTSFLTLLCTFAGAGNDVDLSFAKSLWFGSGNASGLKLTPLEDVKTATLGYDFASGPYHLQQEGETVGKIFFDTQGATKVGAFSLWGRFEYNHISDYGTRYNTLVYDPFDERYIYGVADTTSSAWKRQKYNMEFKAALPFGDRVAGGLHVRYTDKIASKQNDPRTESFNYEILLEPSVSVRMGKGALGLSLCYANSMERSVTTLSNDQLAQDVFVLRGLGNYNPDIVGSGGLRPMYFRTNLFGGGIQYGLSDLLLVEAGTEFSSTELSQSPTEPRPMGRSEVLKVHGDAVYMFKNKNLHKFSLGGGYVSTGGTEYSTKAVSGEGWVIATESLMSRYTTLDAHAAWDGFIMDGDDWKWQFNGKLTYASKNDRYLAPESRYGWSYMGIEARAARKIRLKSASVLKLAANAGFVKGLGGQYVYSGTCGTARTVTEWYPSDLAVRKADRGSAGLIIDWGRLFRKPLELHVALDASALRSSLGTGRYDLTGKVYLVF